MKNFSATLFLLFAVWCATAQVPNMGLDNWQTQTLFETPDGYATSATQTFFSNGTSNVSKVTGNSGAAARLETVVAGGDTIPGFITNDPLFLRGVPFTGQPDSVRLSLRYDIKAGDTALVMFIFKRNGIPFFFPENFVTITGSQSTFTNFTAPLNVPLPPDSLFFMAVSSNLIGSKMMAGSWVEIDAMELVNSTQALPNNGLDNWNANTVTQPAGWMTSNMLSAIGTGNPSVTEVAGLNGSAAQIVNEEVSFFGVSDTLGFMTNSLVFFGNSNSGGSPYTLQPIDLTFDYKYTPVGNDSGAVGVRFTEFNSSTGMSDSINGGILKLKASNNWTTGKLTFDWTGKNSPDSVLIIVSAANIDDDRLYLGSTLVVDNLAFGFATGIRLPMAALSGPVKLFPNPAQKHLTLQWEDASYAPGVIRILSMDGRVIEQFTVHHPGHQYTINVSHLAKGTYLYQTIGNQSHSGTFIIQ